MSLHELVQPDRREEVEEGEDVPDKGGTERLDEWAIWLRRWRQWCI